MNRTGNIFVPNERYIWFEKYCGEVLKKCMRITKNNETITGEKIIYELGKNLEGKKEQNRVSLIGVTKIIFLYFANH